MIIIIIIIYLVSVSLCHDTEITEMQQMPSEIIVVELWIQCVTVTMATAYHYNKLALALTMHRSMFDNNLTLNIKT